MEKTYVEHLTKMDEDFAKWYTDIVLKAELVDYGETKGTMVIRPYGYSIWENIQEILNKKIKETGHKNVYFPTLIPESLLEKEKNHLEGFAPEVFLVESIGDKKLEEKLCLRPTSETIICTSFAKWIKSHRDLPLLINQWANVFRAEKTTRPFLRTSEFLWQEGHTLHATKEEAIEETEKMYNVYIDFFENYLAIPIIKGIKTDKEKFAGAETTYTVEALMHDGKALQSGTSHYLGQNFSKPFDIKYQSKEGKLENPHQTSWGVSSRMIGGIIMTHGDDRGLKLPPKIAPVQVIIIPIAQHKEGVIDKVNELKDILKVNFRVETDLDDKNSPGFKFNDAELKGIPVRIEMGPKDIENNRCIVVRRDTFEKIEVSLDKIEETITNLLEEIQVNMFNLAKENLERKTTVVHNFDEYKKAFEKEDKLIKMMWCGNVECENKVKEDCSSTFRCIPNKQENLDTKCAICGKDAKCMVYSAKQY